MGSGTSRHSWLLHPGLGIYFYRIYDGQVYGSFGVTGSKRTTSRMFWSRNYKEQYALALATYVKWQGWPHAPKSWRKPPDYQKVLKQCHVIERPNPDIKDRTYFDLIDL